MADAWDLIVDPFFDNGGIDMGAVLAACSTSLQRVAIGFGFAAVVGVALGALIGQSDLGDARPRPDLPGAAHRAAAGLAAAVAGGFRDSPSLGDLRDLHHLDLADHHQHRVGVRNIPQDYRNVAAVLRLSRSEFFCKIMLPAAAPYIFTGLRIGIGLSWLAIVAAEMLTGGVGIGFFIWDAWNSSRISDIIVALVYIGIVGFCSTA